MALALLSALGCRTTGVAGADEALRLPPDDFDLVFSDVMMPGSMDGVELARCILTERPGLPVLLTSGYVVAPERLDGLHVGFLAKPYNAASLRTALGGILEQKAAASGR